MANPINIGTGTGGVAVAITSIGVVANLDQQGATIYDCEMYNGTSPAVVQLINLSTGANTISASNCPALPQAGGVIIIPPAGNVNTITLKGVTGDTGNALCLTAPTIYTFPAVPPTSFVLTLSSGITGMKLLWF